MILFRNKNTQKSVKSLVKSLTLPSWLVWTIYTLYITTRYVNNDSINVMYLNSALQKYRCWEFPRSVANHAAVKRKPEKNSGLPRFIANIFLNIVIQWKPKQLISRVYSIYQIMPEYSQWNTPKIVIPRICVLIDWLYISD